MSFANPTWLILLLALPLTWVIGYPRRPHRKQRDRTSLVLRTLLLLCVIFAISGAQLVRDVDKLAVIFLVDASDSIGSDLRDAQLDYIEAAIADKPSDDEWGVVVFGANVSIDKPLSNITDVAPLRSEVLGNNTDIAEALQTAISLFPADARRRIVILSDGQQTVGDAEAKARLADVSGVEISYVPFFQQRVPDVRITELDTPARVNEGQIFDINVTVAAETATDATLLLFAGGQLITEEAVSLDEGSNRYTFSQRSDEGGFRNFSARVTVPGAVDSFSQNNELGAFSEIVGASRVLVVASLPGDLVHLVPALETAGLTVNVVEPQQLPADVASFAPYDSVVMVNVPATDLSEAQMQRLDSYVSDLGGGLVFIGGPNSYGPGGYFETTLEDTLPVEMRIRDQERLPQLTIAYLIDSSGSMGSLSQDGLFTNLQLSLRAVDRSIDFLQSSDRVAVGTFDSGGQWVVRFQEAENRQAIQEQLSTMRPGGGTNILSGLRLVERDIGAEPSERKHLILLTDGGASRVGLVDKVEALNEDFGVTVSVIAIGTLSVDFLEDMAEAGDGNFHRVTDASQIPNIFAQETVLATRSYIQEGDFALQLTNRSPIMQGISELPPVRGYVAATPKSTAQVILRAPDPFADPILAQWQYGLGRVVAFTSDATSRWGTAWVNWGDFSRFWGQAVDWTITESSGQNIEAQVVVEDEQARLIVDARAEDGTFLNNLTLRTSVIAPDDTSRTLRLQQTAPGRYEATFQPQDEGAYYLAINGGGTTTEGDALAFNEVTGWVRGYSAEYAQTQPDETLLASLATTTGGQSLQDTPDETFATTQDPRTAVAPIWQWLLWAALLILPFDIAIRRLIITRSDWQRLRAYIFGDPDAPSPSEERLSSLFGARERARQRTQMGARDATALDALQKTRTSEDNEDNDDTSPATSVPRRTPTTTPERNRRGTVGNLLKNKRRRSDDDTDEDDES